MLSLNELHALVVKASVGAGLSFGHAQEIAAAAVWLGQRGFPVFDIVVQGLARAGSDRQSILGRDAATRATFEDAIAVLDGPSAIDLLLAAPCSEFEVVLRTTDEPRLIFGLAGIAAERHQIAITFSAAEVRLIVGPTCRLRPDDIVFSSVSPITLSRIGTQGQPSGRPLDTRYDPGTTSDTGLKQLQLLAARTYVPSSEASRESGAGAGLTDND